jgi:hypothetical protein
MAVAGVFLAGLLFSRGLFGEEDEASSSSGTNRVRLEEVFARGPLAVQITTKNGETKPCQLLGLTPTRLVRREGENARIIVVRAATGLVAKIECADKQATWTLDPQTKLFGGPKIAQRAYPPIEVSRVEAAPQKEAFYLYVSWRQWQRTGYEMAIQGDQAQEWQALSKKVAGQAERMERRKIPRPLIDLYRALPDYFGTIARTTEAHAKAVAEYDRAMNKLAQARQRAMEERQTRTIVSLAEMFIGGMSTHRDAYLDNGEHVTVEDGIVSPELFQEGFSGMLNVGMDAAREEMILRNAQHVSDAKVREEVEAAVAEQKQSREKLSQDYVRAGERLFQLKDFPEVTLEEVLAAAKQRKAEKLNALLEQRSRIEREKLGAEHPLTEVERAAISVYLPSPDAAKQRTQERMANLAKAVFAAAKRIPQGELFDIDLSRTLMQAGDFEMQGAQSESKEVRWVDAFSPMARQAARLYAAALKYGPRDPGELIRERLAVANYLSGDAEAGLKQMEEIRAARQEDPRFLFNLSRMYAGVEETREAEKLMTGAILEQGFDDIAEAAECPEFRNFSAEFKALTRLDVAVKLENSYAQKLILANGSKLPLRDVNITYSYQATSLNNHPQGTKIVKLHFEVLDPGQNVDLPVEKDTRPAIGSDGNREGRVTVRTANLGTKVVPFKIKVRGATFMPNIKPNVRPAAKKNHR